MRFYDALQLNPGDLKQKINSAQTPAERRRYWLAMLVRAILIVAFSILLIAPLTTLFGSENSSMAVALICIILSIRFVDFGYCIRDSILNLGIVFLLLLAAPTVAALLPPVLGAVVHFCAFFLILSMTSDQPEMGNGGLYAFSYVFLVGNPVTGVLLAKRAMLTLAAFLICAAIFYPKHKDKHKNVRYKDVATQFHLSTRKSQWQLQLALGVSLLLLLGDLIGLERMMWAGFACASMLGCYTSSVEDHHAVIRERFLHRMVGAVVGSGLFMVIYTLTPPQYYGLFGPIGGVFLGFCSDYRSKTALNCFGALMLATGLYGLHGSVLLRVVNNFLGAAFGYGFSVLYHKLMSRRFDPANA